MPKLNLIDDLLAPSDTLKVNYKGMNSAGILGLVPGMIKEVMKIPGKDLLETDIRWDITSENRSFYGVWMGKRTEDRWTQTIIRVIAQGEQNAKDNTGWFKVQLKGTLETKYDFNNFIQRSFWWFYNYSFYFNQRRKMLESGKDDLFDMRNVITDKFKISKE